MKPYAMVLPSTAFFGSSVGNFFVKSFNTGEAYLLLLLVLAFTMTYGLGYVVMCKISPHYKETMSPPLEKAEVINNNVQVSDIPHVNTHESNKTTTLEETEGKDTEDDSDQELGTQSRPLKKGLYDVEKDSEKTAGLSKKVKLDDESHCIDKDAVKMSPIYPKNLRKLKKKNDFVVQWSA
ncbi:uncharacterized protein LOC111264961 isoform X1 [Varroa jacobsoni]|uniref:uncharacterized protein LOC111264961 isoform X1 n=1 Tax=Varroa jacobsoni TaxID=62625 RepID=UPI000BF7B9CC|nr:uncharacterized protein LOC111264961 isoform X1 [Varroa jacobsoni]